MKKQNKIQSKNTESIDSENNMDKILDHYNIDFSEIDFNKHDTDTLKSLKSVNNRLNQNSNYLKNLKSIFSVFNFKPILKPLYTVILTSVLILAIIEFNKTKDPVQYAEVSVDAGERITLHITDNITVWLNSESTIKIPLEIKKNSKLYLEGEAYFEVGQRHRKEIEVISKNIIFKANTASFYINSNEKPNVLTARVKEGSIELYNPLLPKSTSLMLDKGQKATYNSLAEFMATEKDNGVNYLAWKTGLLNFNNTGLAEVSEILTKYYNIPISVENKNLVNKTFTATFNNADIDEVLDKIQSKFNCEISADGNKLIIN